MKTLIDQKVEKSGGLRATFRHNPPNHIKIYQKSKVILLISIGQEYHEGEKFAATIDLINRSKFNQCFIMLGDFIQRHTMRINNFEPEDVVGTLARKAGDEWLERNKLFYNKLEIPYEIIRWDHWLSHPSYKEYREKVNKLYQDNELARQEFLKTVSQFLSRYEKNIKEQTDHERAFKLCLEYLQEECAIIMPLWAEDSYEFLIYPSEMLDAMRTVYNELVKPYYKNVLHWLPLRFKRKESYKVFNVS